MPGKGSVVGSRQDPVGLDDLLVTTFRASRSYPVWFFRAVSLADNLNAGATFTAPRGDRLHDGHNVRLHAERCGLSNIKPSFGNGWMLLTAFCPCPTKGSCVVGKEEETMTKKTQR